jgi:hypothetical protein
VKVVATKLAFYNGFRVRPGAELEVPEGLKGSWFAPVASPEAKAAKAPKAPKSETRTLSEIGKPAATTFSEAHLPPLA